ncbi:Ppx/GppA phosphatase family protein [Phenylobacterium sp.]|uniref:Ppx/GppA phosphatase family protein n=1 Tax=Phenylobacterium sp. TaxID=1871053 RepID=UPI002BD2CF22|nr:Ppx/GppA phosphatase family protein [Phenylobacterium sp.]HVI32993.1 Ppx/GppA phosphatase family protein [Phenylobacterium sp.]
MNEAPSAPGAQWRGRDRSAGDPPCYAALDLGTNNCRLLIATPAGQSFRVVEAYSRIVRLGEGLDQSGRLSDVAMERALAALKVSAEKVRRRRVVRLRAIATQACRMAENGPAFIDRVFDETGMRLQIISPQEEARLSVQGCLNLLDRSADAALVVDVGGGSTELSWVELRDAPPTGLPPIRAWLSVPIGVVTLAERYPEDEDATEAWFRRMVEAVKGEIAAFRRADPMREVFDADRAHLVGTSGAITSLAGLHLNLMRYDRSRVDGIWMSRDECDAAAGRLLSLNARQRADQPCIGPDRADLVLAGAAILQAVQELWPCSRVRVADRGLREGILLSLMAERGGRRRRKRRPRRAEVAA